MAENEPSGRADRTTGPGVGRIVLAAGGAIIAAGLLYITLGDLFKQEAVHGRGPAGESWVMAGSGAAPTTNKPAVSGAQAADAAPLLHVIPELTPASEAKPAPLTPFVDADGKPVDLSHWKGKVVLVNLWATWCGPCRTEMPALAALQKSIGRDDFVVLPVSIDSRRATDKAKAFIAENAPLSFHQDLDYALPPALDPPIEGVPATLFIDRQGRIRARVLSDADWSGDKAHALIRRLLAE